MGTGDDFVNFGNQDYILEQYKAYQADPNSIEGEWKAFFQGVSFASQAGLDVSSVGSGSCSDLRIELLHLAYQKFGHLGACADPMLDFTAFPKELAPEKLGFSNDELTQTFPTGGILPTPEAPLQEIINRLNAVYLGSIGYEFSHISDPTINSFLTSQVIQGVPELTEQEEYYALQELCRAKFLEEFLHKKFLGAKRFSVEGGESLMPMVHELFDLAAHKGYEDGMICMAHRGRLNVLCNLLGKPYSALFHEFKTGSLPVDHSGAGDVKYHNGYKNTIATLNGQKINLQLASNPSHLEAVDPVMVGMSYGLLSQSNKKILPLMIHGDAAVAGQGVVYETMQLSKLEGYGIGGTVHLVINNQIGFTATPDQSRSTTYCTDIAKTFDAPVMHVNAEDIPACIHATRIAFALRDRFGIEVFIDLNCHRLYGHNESDEPMFTNPQLYRKIKAKDNIYVAYKELLAKKPVMAKVTELESLIKEELNQALKDSDKEPMIEPPGLECTIIDYLETPKESWFPKPPPSVSKQTLSMIAEQIAKMPNDFSPHPKIKRVLAERKEALQSNENKIDWGCGETAAYASLLLEGVSVRISGQDSRRGTFSHRHAMLIDQDEEKTYTPLQHLTSDQAPFTVYNSSLSENAVLGFEYGYSLTHLKSLVIWEAQFGDFANGAQVVIDQFISSTESKWNLPSHLTVFLPHGQEGMGSEHSSGRMERFLQLAGTCNWRVVYPTSSGQMFHLLRSQGHLENRIPLIVFTPKSMLRFPPSFSSSKDLLEGTFQQIIEHPNYKAKRLIFCTGKIYYELEAAREEKKLDSVAIVRIEELYPLHMSRLKEVIGKYNQASEYFFVQEEHSNQGAYDYLVPYFREILGENQPLQYVGRVRCSVPATGYAAVFKKEQQEIIAKALNIK